MTDGTERFGPYELVSLVGRGGMGEVYRAYDTVRRRTVALKRLPRHLAGDRDFEMRFRREAEVAARLTEPHIIPIHDYGEIDGQLYIDMRLITGTDLGEVIAKAGALAPQRAVAIIGQVATALAAAHAEGLVHRDVKPSNVLISTTDRGEDFVHLVDFGIVHERNSTVLTATGSAIGTVDYMAPERLQQQESDHRVDVYALGCVLFEALTGGKPFPTGSTAATMFAHMQTPPPRPSQSRPGIPPGLDDVVLHAMAKNPAQRYGSTTELATDAYRALSGVPTGGATRIGPGVATGFGTAYATGYPAGPPPTEQGPAPVAATRMSFAPPDRTAAGPTPTAAGAPAPAPRSTRRLVPLLVVAAVVIVAIVVATVVFARSGTPGSATPTAAGLPTAVGTRAPATTGAAQAPAPTAGQDGAVAPAAGATSTVTNADGGQTAVQTATLQLCGGDGVSLASGQQVPTTSISRLDVTYAGDTATSVTITGADGQTVEGQVAYGCTVTGLTSLGKFSLELNRVRSLVISR